MRETVINKELTVSVPDGFYKMDAVELEKYFGLEYNRWGVMDKKRGVIISVCWTTPGKVGLFDDSKKIVAKAEASFCKNLKRYKRISDFTGQIGSSKVYGIRYEYKTDKTETEIGGEMLAFKFNKKFYAVYYITRKDHFAEYHGDVDTLVGSIRLPVNQKKGK